MSEAKRKIRSAFRDSVFHRDQYRCRACGYKPPNLGDLDAHHVTDRNEMPNGGYVKENGITLCKGCHEKAEVFHSTGTALPGFSPEELYQLIRSDRERAVRASEKLTH